MWLRLHKPPKVARGTWIDEMSPKQRYYFDHSFGRYSKTDDGLRVNDIAQKSFASGELGRIEGVRFITSKKVGK